MSYHHLLYGRGRDVASAIALGALLGAAAACADSPGVAGPTQAVAPTAAFALVAPSSTPATLANGANTALCADVRGAGTANDTRIILYRCTGNANQKFALMPSGELKVYGTKCIESSGYAGRDGDPVVLFQCDGGANQRWRYTAARELRGLNNRCIAPIDGVKSLSRLALKNCNGSAAQKWSAVTSDSAPPPPPPPPPDTTPTPPPDTTPTPPPPPPPPPPPSTGRWVSAYYVGYQRSLYPESQIDFSAMTHIIVGRLKPNVDGSIATDFDIDNVNGPAMAKNVSQRAHAAGRKAILMLGGDGEHAGFVGAASSANRPTFVRNLIQAMDNYGYDGIDVDWEPMDQADEAPLLALLKDLRAARPGIILTIPVGFQSANFPDRNPWYAQAAPVVDQMNLMTYGMADAWPGWVSWHSSALNDAQGDHPTSIASSIQVYLDVGVPASKLGIGIGFYGQCWRGPTGPRQSTGSGVVASDNTMSYANIMSQYYVASARQWDAAAGVPYLSFPTAKGPQGCNFVSYDDEQSISGKGAWVKSKGLGGAIIWTVAQGHLPSAPAGQQDPLLKAAYNSIVP